MKYTFTKKVLEIVRSISSAQMMSYKEVAKKAPSPCVSRAVDIIMNNNYDESVSCYMAIKSNGEVDRYNRADRSILKEHLIEEEKNHGRGI
ncbi:MAG: alkylated DNA nucleotide flippase Atl1 [Flavobacteriaceae bacterium]|jgi:alkylated DNA nucleotide flippase Atl1